MLAVLQTELHRALADGPDEAAYCKSAVETRRLGHGSAIDPIGNVRADVLRPVGDIEDSIDPGAQIIRRDRRLEERGDETRDRNLGVSGSSQRPRLPSGLERVLLRRRLCIVVRTVRR